VTTPEPDVDPLVAVFDRTAPSYDSVIPFFARFGARLVELAGVRPGEDVLDVACGRGASLLPAATAVGNAGRAVGVDAAPTMVALLCGDLAAGPDLPAFATRGDAASLAFADASFDVAMCGFTIMMLREPDRVAAEMMRVLRPGGRLALSVPTGATRVNDMLGAIVAPYAARAVRPLPPQPAQVDVPELAKRAGFVEVAVVEETEEFAFGDPDAWWRWAWTIGMRLYLEAFDEATLAEMRVQAEARMRAMADGGTVTFEQHVQYVVARRP
jgi:ubiquinone/menaquinone biosynthesis C-methylase UbiE